MVRWLLGGSGSSNPSPIISTSTPPPVGAVFGVMLVIDGMVIWLRQTQKGPGAAEDDTGARAIRLPKEADEPLLCDYTAGPYDASTVNQYARFFASTTEPHAVLATRVLATQVSIAAAFRDAMAFLLANARRADPRRDRKTDDSEPVSLSSVNARKSDHL